MDPNATLSDLIDAAVQGDSKAIITTAHALAYWLEYGGFPPNDPRIK